MLYNAKTEKHLQCSCPEPFSYKPSSQQTNLSGTLLFDSTVVKWQVSSTFFDMPTYDFSFKYTQKKLQEA